MQKHSSSFPKGKKEIKQVNFLSGSGDGLLCGELNGVLIHTVPIELFQYFYFFPTPCCEIWKYGEVIGLGLHKRLKAGGQLCIRSKLEKASY